VFRKPSESCLSNWAVVEMTRLTSVDQSRPFDESLSDRTEKILPLRETIRVLGGGCIGLGIPR
jgi:hypothetical protein